LSIEIAMIRGPCGLPDSSGSRSFSLMTSTLRGDAKHRLVARRFGTGIRPVIKLGFGVRDGAGMRRLRQNGYPPKPAARHRGSIPIPPHTLESRTRCFSVADEKRLTSAGSNLGSFRSKRSKKASHSVNAERACDLSDGLSRHYIGRTPPTSYSSTSKAVRHCDKSWKPLACCWLHGCCGPPRWRRPPMSRTDLPRRPCSSGSARTTSCAYGVDDPEVEGWPAISPSRRRRLKAGSGLRGVSDISLACRQIGPIHSRARWSRATICSTAALAVLSEDADRPWLRRQRNVLVYMVYSDKLIEGSPKNSTVLGADHALGIRRQARSRNAVSSFSDRNSGERNLNYR